MELTLSTPKLSFKEIKSGLPAGLVVFLEAVPLCLGIAMASGASLFAGIISGIIGAIVFADLLTGIGIGMAVAVLSIRKNSYKVSHMLHQEKAADGKEQYDIALAEEVTFRNKGNIMQALRQVPEGAALVIDSTRSAVMDHNVKKLIQDFKESAHRKNITLTFKEPESAGQAERPQVTL